MKFHIKIIQAGDCYIGQLVEIPAVITQSSNREELQLLIIDALEEYWRSFDSEVAQLNEESILELHIQ